ncbi:putative DsbA family dithiol-disulfide isomerase [Nocardiopsis sp. Huas11]|uniref:DsbA family oxidoreductase n=1 Tax=Nocardiopsis sp. Huas11 TaxID=2183912 RepID=UPI000EB2C016|nr:DsbA family oxidoreductase [Nocardiopsis sp. Huas11]RKS05610.1 putative DsbA family dithiol-disulfide isomerase [Nocardiopsis sp. Huas11]
MRIEIWADVVCPWAYIGKRRLERGLAAWEGEDVEVVWRPFRIDPTAPAGAEPLDELLRDPWVDAELRACAPHLTTEQNRTRVAELAAAEGLGPRWGAGWRVSSGQAHRLIALALREGGPRLQDAVVEGVLHAHFVAAEDIGSAAVLDRVAREAGFPEGGPLLSGDAGEREVRELLLRGRAIGVRTSPTFTVGGRALAGAQEGEAVLEFAAEAARAAERGPARMPEEVERLRLAESLLGAADPLGALTLLAPLLEEHSADRNVLRLAARCYARSAQLGRAERTLADLLAQEPGDAYAHRLMGSVLRRRGEGERAAPHLRLASAMAPEYD